MKIDYSRLIIVAALHGEKYIGHVPKGVKNAPAYMESAAKANQPVRITEVRTILSQPQVTELPTGEKIIGGMVAILPFEFFPGPADQVWVRASSWHFPAENPGSKKKIDLMLKSAVESEAKLEQLEKQMEAVQAAQKAGLTVPQGGPILVPKR